MDRRLYYDGHELTAEREFVRFGKLMSEISFIVPRVELTERQIQKKVDSNPPVFIKPESTEIELPKVEIWIAEKDGQEHCLGSYGSDEYKAQLKTLGLNDDFVVRAKNGLIKKHKGYVITAKVM